MNKQNLTIGDFNEALFAINGDSKLIETKEHAKYVKRFIEDKTLRVLLPGDNDFSEVCAKLDVSEANLRKAYIIVDTDKTKVGYLALSDDWD